jgi:hypothetical protein
MTEHEKDTALPELPQGLRSPMTVVAYKGITGKSTIVLRDLNTQAMYRLDASTIKGWEIPAATKANQEGDSIIVTLTPSMVALHLSTGELYREGPPPSSLHLRKPAKATRTRKAQS